MSGAETVVTIILIIAIVFIGGIPFVTRVLPFLVACWHHLSELICEGVFLFKEEVAAWDDYFDERRENWTRRKKEKDVEKNM